MVTTFLLATFQRSRESTKKGLNYYFKKSFIVHQHVVCSTPQEIQLKHITHPHIDLSGMQSSVRFSIDCCIILTIAKSVLYES